MNSHFKWIQRITALLLVTVLCLVSTGCPQQQTIASLTQILGSAAVSVAALEGNDQLATQLKADTTAAVTAIQNWKSGSPSNEAIQALQLVQEDLSLFPISNKYDALIALAIGTVEGILELLPQSTPPPTPAEARGRYITLRHVKLSNPPKTKGQFKKRWNAIVEKDSSLAKAKLN